MAQDKAEDVAGWMAHVREQVQAETASARVVEQKYHIRQDPHVIMSAVPNAGQKWSGDRRKKAVKEHRYKEKRNFVLVFRLSVSINPQISILGDVLNNAF